MAATAASVLTGAIINIVTALIGLLVFSYLRRWHKAYKFYDARRYTPELAHKPNALPSTFFGWLTTAWSYPEPDIIRQCGLDTAIYLRILRFGFEIFVWITVWCILVVLPTNYTDNECDNLMAQNTGGDGDYKFTNFDHLSLSNVQPGSYRMFVHVFTTWFVSILVLWVMWRYCKESVLLRIMFLGAVKPGGPTHSILVTDIPGIAEQTAAAVKEKDKAEAEAKKAAKKPAKEASKAKAAKAGVAASTSEAGSSASNTDTAASQTTTTRPGPVAEGKEDIEAGSEAISSQGVSVSLSDPGKGTVRRRRTPVATDSYDLKDTSLDPAVIARDMLADGASPQELVEDEFNHLFPGGQVMAVNVVHDQSGLDGLVAEYNQIKLKLEDLLDGVEFNTANNKPLVRPKTLVFMPSLGDWGKERYGGGFLKKVDAIDHWLARMEYLEGEILKKQGEAKVIAWPSAFITFSTRAAQSVAANSLTVHDERVWVSRNAPGPDELIWSNLGMTSAMRSNIGVLMWVLFWLMAMFYMIPVGAIQGLIDVPKLAKTPGLKAFVSNVVIKKLLEAIVPGLVLKIFLALVPFILATMARKAGAVSLSEVDFSVVGRFFLFQLVVVFFGTIVAGSFFSQATAFINNPTGIVNTLGTAIPQTSTFFISYIWVLLGVTAIGHIRIVPLVLYWVFTWLAQGPKAKERVYQQQFTTFGTVVTTHTIALLLGLVFCVINPIICPSVLVYFILAGVVERYNHIFVYRRNYESGGLMWKQVFTQVMIALYIFQLCMIGLISIKKFPYSPLVIPVILPTIAFHLTVLSLFNRTWTLMSLHDAASLDESDRLVAKDVEVAEEARHVYLSPVFKVNKGDVDHLLEETKVAATKINADVERQEKEKAAEEEAKKAGKASKGKKGTTEEKLAADVESRA